MTDDDEPATREQLDRIAELLGDYGVTYAEGLSGFLDDLRSDSPLQVILRGHLWVEAEIVALLSAGIAHPAHLDDRMPFGTRVRLAVALGLLDEEWIPPLLQLNEQRNKLAHRLDHQVTEEAEAALIRAMPGDADTLERAAVMDGETAFPSALRGVILLLVAVVSAQRRFVELGAPLRLKFHTRPETQRT